MSVDALSALPLQAGQAVAAAAGRTAMWVISAYLRAPLRNTAIAALTTFSAMAGSNALYHQSGHHPAPLFGSFDSKPAIQKATQPVMPMERPVKLSLPAPETTGSVSPKQVSLAPTTTVAPIGNEDVFEVQRKLTAFKLFDGKVDGLYGPRTARAIKAFQTSVGQEPTGKLTREIVDLIKSTPITAEPVKLVTTPQVAVEPVEPVPAASEKALQLVEPKVEKALPAPAPLLAATEAGEPAAEEVAALQPTIDETGVSSLSMTSPPEAEAAPLTTGPTKRTVQTIAVRAPATEAATTPPAIETAPIDVLKSATDPKVVGAVQRGLASLGFLHGEIDGVAGEATAKAIRNFEVYYNYNVTGRITPELVNLLVQNGAVI
jgi:peptidoglycan hydrolase-like protein with peptidoglycan-binding domain